MDKLDDLGNGEEPFAIVVVNNAGIGTRLAVVLENGQIRAIPAHVRSGARNTDQIWRNVGAYAEIKKLSKIDNPGAMRDFAARVGLTNVSFRKIHPMFLPRGFS